MKKGEGWAISGFRLPISGQHGSSTTVFLDIRLARRSDTAQPVR
jgi:hypothetical protein